MTPDWYTKIIDIGNSKGVILPKVLLKLLDIDQKGSWVKVSVNSRSKSIQVTKTKKPKITL